MNLIGKKVMVREDPVYKGIIVAGPEFNGYEFVVLVKYYNGALATIETSRLVVIDKPYVYPMIKKLSAYSNVNT